MGLLESSIRDLEVTKRERLSRSTMLYVQSDIDNMGAADESTNVIYLTKSARDTCDIDAPLWLPDRFPLYPCFRHRYVDQMGIGCLT